MATTIRVGDVIKEEFDRLRRGIESTEGHRITAEEVLARLLRTARSHPEHVVHEEDVL